VSHLALKILGGYATQSHIVENAFSVLPLLAVHDEQEGLEEGGP